MNIVAKGREVNWESFGHAWWVNDEHIELVKEAIMDKFARPCFYKEEVTECEEMGCFRWAGCVYGGFNSKCPDYIKPALKETKENLWMEEARCLVAQCRAKEETDPVVMDAAFAEEVATRMAAWMETAAQSQRNADFYLDLLVKCGEHIGKKAYTQDDGGKSGDVLCAKVPELVRELVSDQVGLWRFFCERGTENANLHDRFERLKKSNEKLQARVKELETQLHAVNSAFEIDQSLPTFGCVVAPLDNSKRVKELETENAKLCERNAMLNVENEKLSLEIRAVISGRQETCIKELEKENANLRDEVQARGQVAFLNEGSIERVRELEALNKELLKIINIIKALADGCCERMI